MKINRYEVAVYVGIGYREVGFWNGFFKDEVNDFFEAFFSVDR